MQLELTKEEVAVVRKAMLYYEQVIGMSLNPREAVAKIFFSTGAQLDALLLQFEK